MNIPILKVPILWGGSRREQQLQRLEENVNHLANCVYYFMIHNFVNMEEYERDEKGELAKDSNGNPILMRKKVSLWEHFMAWEQEMMKINQAQITQEGSKITPITK